MKSLSYLQSWKQNQTLSSRFSCSVSVEWRGNIEDNAFVSEITKSHTRSCVRLSESGLNFGVVNSV